MPKAPPPRKRRREERSTNGPLVGGIVAIGVIGLFALLFITVQNQGVPTPTPEPDLALIDFCEANEENCVAKGEPDAPVTVIEVADYGCPHCRNFNIDAAPMFDAEFVETGAVEWMVLPYALRTATQPPAAAALCARDQGAFWEFHNAMFEIQDTDLALTREGFVTAAEELGLDVDAFESCLDSGEYEPVIANNVAVAARAGVSATPTFFVNGALVEGNDPNRLEAAITAELDS